MTKEDLKKKFLCVCTNSYRAVDKNGKPFLYRRSDLTMFARQAVAEGKRTFCCQPVDPLDPYGELELCEPKYAYRLISDLTPEEFNLLFTE